MRHIVGTAQIGAPYGSITKTVVPTEGAARELIDLSIRLSHGLDTARDYPESEATLGAHLPQVLPESFDLATKLTSRFDQSISSVERAVEESVFLSCKLLNRSRVPSLLLHRCAHLRMYGGAIWRRVLQLRREGVIGRIGVSVQNPDEFAAAVQFEEIQCIQMPFNILDTRWDEHSIRNVKERRGDLEINVRSVFLQGVLLRSADAWPSLDGYAPQEVVDWLIRTAREAGAENVQQLCIGFCRAKDWIDGAVIGAETPAQLLENVRHLTEACLAPEIADKVARSRPAVPSAVLDPSRWRNP